MLLSNGILTVQVTSTPTGFINVKYRVMQHNMPVTQHNIHVFLPNLVLRDEEKVWIPQLNADTAVQQAAYFSCLSHLTFEAICILQSCTS